MTADFRAAKVAIRNGLAGAAFGGRAFIVPAADAAAKYLATFPEPHGRRLVVMFTGDGGAGLSGLKDQSHAKVAQDFWEADASLSAMVIPNALTRMMHDVDPAHFGVVHQLGLAFSFSPEDTIDEVAELDRRRSGLFCAG